jgi:hypothetical protein
MIKQNYVLIMFESQQVTQKYEQQKSEKLKKFTDNSLLFEKVLFIKVHANISSKGKSMNV